MSRLLPDELRIVLCPERVALLRSGRKLTLRGYKRDVLDSGIVACEPAAAGDKPWRGALNTLELALPSFTQRKMKVEVILSNHFVQYILVPWLDNLSDEEELAFAHHCFREVHGTAADSWSVRTSPGRAGAATIASAVDTALLEELRALLERMGLDIHSIQPHLMTACNSCRNSLEGRSAWVALLEPGNLCLARLQQGELVWIRKLRIGDAWDEELPALLEREQLLADAEDASNEVLLWAPQLETAYLTVAGRWQIRQLKPGQDADDRQAYAGLHSMMAGA